MKNASFVILHNDIHLVMLFRAKDHCWGFPGGKVEQNESLVDAACREVFEEIGIKLCKDDLTFKAAHKISDTLQSNVYTTKVKTNVLIDVINNVANNVASCSHESIGAAVFDIYKTDFTKLKLAPTVLEEIQVVFGIK